MIRRGSLRRGDIIFVDVESGRGSEQGGRRPAVVIQNDIGNKFSPTVIVAFLTSQQTKAKMPTHVYIDKRTDMILLPGKNLDSNISIVLCEQLRTLDTECRVTDIIGRLPEKSMKKVDHALLVSVGLA
jgi:mRNA interferase MazF